MDALSDLLRVVRLDGAYFFAVKAAPPWSVDTVPAKELSPRILPSAEHLVSYHIVTEGSCYAGLIDAESVKLVAGDVIVFPQGDAHLLSSAPGARSRGHLHRTVATRYREQVVLGDDGAPSVTFVCGFLGLDRRPFNPLLASLPRMMHMRGLSTAWHGAFAQQLAEESRLGRAGADEVLTRLAEVMFIEVLRRHLDEMPSGQTGWLAGVKDEVVGRALTLLHARPGHSWTLAELAHDVAASRSSLAKRFAEMVGQPPMQYLAQWRMQVAANQLTQGGAKVATIAMDVGYESEAAFSRAFKKATGESPGAWRESRRAARG